MALMIRHHRGMATAFEKWARDVPPETLADQTRAVLSVYRGILSTVEAQLSAHVDPGT